MAKQIITTVTDDIDGTTDAQTVTFGLQGTAYSIDLSAKNLEKLTKVLAPYIAKASRQRGGTVRRTEAKTPATKVASAPERGYKIVDLREWAGKNEIALPQRGRIPAAIVTQYLAAGRR